MDEMAQELLLKSEKLAVMGNLLKHVDFDDKSQLTSDMLKTIQDKITEIINNDF